MVTAMAELPRRSRRPPDLARQIKVTGVSVYIGTPVDNEIPPETVGSYMDTSARLAAMGIRWGASFERSGIITNARDLVVDSFLKSDFDKLAMIDSDMVWSPEDFLQMLALSTIKDVVASPYHSKIDDTPFTLNDGGFSHDLDEYGTCRIRGTGLGFAFFDRKVIEAVAEGRPKVREGISGRVKREIFRTGYEPVPDDPEADGTFLGEDMAFFDDVRAAGYDVWLCPHLVLGHIGKKQWRGSLMNPAQSQKE